MVMCLGLAACSSSSSKYDELYDTQHVGVALPSSPFGLWAGLAVRGGQGDARIRLMQQSVTWALRCTDALGTLTDGMDVAASVDNPQLIGTQYSGQIHFLESKSFKVGNCSMSVTPVTVLDYAVANGAGTLDVWDIVKISDE
jgi:hypothetical protein